MRTIAYLAMAGVLSAAGCDLQMGGELVDNPPPSPPTTTTGEVRADGFPCEVRAVLQARCGECHTGNTYTVSFHSREIWLAPWRDGAPWQRLVSTEKAPRKPARHVGALMAQQAEQQGGLWWWCLLIAALFLLFELTLANRTSR
jgi:hypothetical protein